MKENRSPLVSVITVCRNAGESLLQTAKSITGQTYRPLEYIIIDGASADGTLTVIQQIQEDCDRQEISLQWVSEPDGGIYDAMNKGVRMARGEWLNFMNAGDFMASPQAVSQAMGTAKSDTDIVYGSTNVIMDFGTVTLKPAPLSRLIRKMAICHQSTFIRTSLLREHPYDLNFPIAADYEFIHWCYVSGKRFCQTDCPLASFESENGKSSRNRLQMNREFAQISGQDKTMKWKVTFALKVMEAGFNKVLRMIMPKNLKNRIRERNYQRIKQGREGK